MPTSAIEIAQRELGDKDNQIVGGGTDPQSGVTFSASWKGRTGHAKENGTWRVQYMLLQEAHGDKVAWNLFAANYKQECDRDLTIERERIKKAGASKYPKSLTLRLTRRCLRPR